MKLKKQEFPHPLLAQGKDDYNKTCNFSMKINKDLLKTEGEFISVTAEYVLNCNCLQSLINEDKAVAALTANSTVTSYSRLWQIPKEKRELCIKIPKYDVAEYVDLSICIIASKDLKGFEFGEELNSLYFGDTSFDIRKGDILAYSEIHRIYLDGEELEGRVSSIFNIVRKETGSKKGVSSNKEQVIVSFDDEKIRIFVDREIHESYCFLKDFNGGILRRYATAVLVYPALVEAVAKVCKATSQNGCGDGGYQDKLWYRVIDRKIRERDLDVAGYEESYMTLADILLGGIVSDGLTSFKEIIDKDLNSGESEMTEGVI